MSWLVMQIMTEETSILLGGLKPCNVLSKIRVFQLIYEKDRRCCLETLNTSRTSRLAAWSVIILLILMHCWAHIVCAVGPTIVSVLYSVYLFHIHCSVPFFHYNGYPFFIVYICLGDEMGAELGGFWG